ncbi:thiol:disulfide interchange protein [Acinetobacter larvae]|uniref:Thiol:disulfide interchange protein n=1 Tax=Acinetobacter larvae TaxID=1789224 RepID=A0A1B2M493_9GAMM|nr:thiol:disulfide interchange protein [Acinetobacter larvae]
MALLLSNILTTHTAYAESKFLPPQQAFQFSAESVSPQQIKLQWKIADHYYLYHDQFKVKQQQQAIKLQLPAGQAKNDPTFGLTDVHYGQVQATIQVQPEKRYTIFWQGCAEEGLCYPMQRATFQTDSTGLLISEQNTTQHNALLPPPKVTNQAHRLNLDTFETAASKQNHAQSVDQKTADKFIPTKEQGRPAIKSEKLEVASSLTTDIAPETNEVDQINTDVTHTPEQKNIAQITETTVDPTENHKLISTPKESTFSLNNDQQFLQLLSPDRFLINLGVFFILGILLAFLPCSLPLIPILSGIIVQRSQGYKAVAVALCFVVSMALVYSLMGIIVAEIGYSVQRWFQNPWIIGSFAVIFILLAFNLFGLYQLSLPQVFINKLDQLQNKQQGGTFIGAAIMGALSALIVGPCMSAPLAGALLFVSQSQNALMGGLYLFILGLGLGLPLFIASVFGAKYLPKPGDWMDRLKFCFGFMMLILAVYFIRPMIGSFYYAVLLAVLCIALSVYFIYLIRVSHKVWTRLFFIAAIGCSIWAAVWQSQQAYYAKQHHLQREHLLPWQQVNTTEQLQQALQQARQEQRPILIDVYADWCVACQPIENDVMPHPDVQQQLQRLVRIKLDLTHYHPSQEQILQQHEILGPPTMLFLNPEGQEQRELRLTGSFSASKFIQQMQRLQATQAQ